MLSISNRSYKTKSRKYFPRYLLIKSCVILVYVLLKQALLCYFKLIIHITNFFLYVLLNSSQLELTCFSRMWLESRVMGTMRNCAGEESGNYTLCNTGVLIIEVWPSMTDDNILLLTSDLQMVELVQTYFNLFLSKLANICMNICAYMNLRFKQLGKNCISVIYQTQMLDVIFHAKNYPTNAFCHADQIKSFVFSPSQTTHMHTHTCMVFHLW